MTSFACNAAGYEVAGVPIVVKSAYIHLHVDTDQFPGKCVMQLMFETTIRFQSRQGLKQTYNNVPEES